VFLFQLGRIDDLAPLFAILAEPRIRKAGVAIRDDLAGLRRLHAFTPRGFAEIADLARGLGIHNTGLRALCAMFLGFRVAKGAKTTNWSNAALTDAQIVYAATDAWASRALYVALARGDRPLHAAPASADAADERTDADAG
jgi:ribonuclease D